MNINICAKLTGKYFVYPLIGTTLIGGMSYDRNE